MHFLHLALLCPLRGFFEGLSSHPTIHPQVTVSASLSLSQPLSASRPLSASLSLSRLFSDFAPPSKSVHFLYQFLSKLLPFSSFRAPGPYEQIFRVIFTPPHKTHCPKQRFWTMRCPAQCFGERDQQQSGALIITPQTTSIIIITVVLTPDLHHLG